MNTEPEKTESFKPGDRVTHKAELFKGVGRVEKLDSSPNGFPRAEVHHAEGVYFADPDNLAPFTDPFSARPEEAFSPADPQEARDILGRINSLKLIEVLRAAGDPKGPDFISHDLLNLAADRIKELEDRLEELTDRILPPPVNWQIMPDGVEEMPTDTELTAASLRAFYAEDLKSPEIQAVIRGCRDAAAAGRFRFPVTGPLTDRQMDVLRAFGVHPSRNRCHCGERIEIFWSNPTHYTEQK